MEDNGKYLRKPLIWAFFGEEEGKGRAIKEAKQFVWKSLAAAIVQPH